MRFAILIVGVLLIITSPIEAQYKYGDSSSERSLVVFKVNNVLSNTLGAFEVTLEFLPIDFWNDAYILGLFHAYSGFYILVNSELIGLPLSSKERKLAAMEVLQLLSETNDLVVAERIIKFFNERNSDFAKGISNADKTLDILMGNINLDDEDVKKAIDRARKSSDLIYGKLPKYLQSYYGVDEAYVDIYYALFDILFLDYAKNKWKG